MGLICALRRQDHGAGLCMHFCSARILTQVVSMQLISRVTCCSDTAAVGWVPMEQSIGAEGQHNSERTEAEGAALSESARIEKCQPSEGERPNDCQKGVRSWVTMSTRLQGWARLWGAHWAPHAPQGLRVWELWISLAAATARGDWKEDGQFP